MGKGAKIAIGCFALLLLAGAGVTVALIGGVWWAKGKAEQYGGALAKAGSDLAKYQQQANANPFTRPPDGSFTEDRLNKFLEVRKQVYQVYQAHQADFEAIKNKKQGDLGDLVKFGGLIGEIKLAQEKAQAEVGMSDGEYIFMVQALIVAKMNAQAQKDSGKTIPEAAGDTLDQARRALGDLAKQGGASGPIDEKTLQQGQQQMEQATKAFGAAVTAPPGNLELYKKHADDINKYAMEGLGLIGL